MVTKSQNDIMLSIITPSYNTPKFFIDAAIESIEKQTSNNYEIVIVDDGSDSSFHLILEEVAKRSEKVNLITAEHNGVSYARNIGVNAAKGKYITFLDADDILGTHFFRDIMAILSDSQPEVVLGGTKIFKKDKEIAKSNKCPDNIRVLKCNGKDRFDLLRYHIDYNFCYSQIEFSDDSHLGRGEIAGRVIRRDVMLEHLFDTNIGFGEDLLWNIQLLLDCEDVLVSNSQWYWYRNNSHSVTRSYNPHIFEESLYLLNEIEQSIDLSNDDLYVGFVDRIYNCVYICWKHYLSDTKTDIQSQKTIEYRIMHEKPWTYLKDERFKKMCSRKMKLFSLLYECNLLFASFRFRDAVDRLTKNRRGE